MPRLGYFKKVHIQVENYIPFFNKRDHYTTKGAQFRIKKLVNEYSLLVNEAPIISIAFSTACT